MKQIFQIGEAFPEQMTRRSKLITHKFSYGNEDGDKTSTNIYFLFLLIVIIFTVIIARLFLIQIIMGKYYRSLSEENRVVEKVIPAQRGVIFDRKGKILAKNIPLYRIFNGKKYQYLEREKAINIEEKNDSNSANMEIAVGREYEFPKELAHIIGFLGEVTKEEMEKTKNEYKLGSLIGKSGIEFAYESILRGKEGKELVETDAHGTKIRVLGKVDPVSGENITLFLDTEIQKTAYEAMLEVIKNERSTAGQNIKGAVIVSDPSSGEILALVSLPTYDNNLFSRLNIFGGAKTKEEKELKEILNNPDMPLFNRAIGGVYPPGSTFKIVTATAGLESGKINKKTLIEDIGVIEIGPYKYPNWLYLKTGQKDGFLNVVTAIKRSNDIFFYKLGELVGLSDLNIWMKKYGLGNILGIDIPGEVGGLIPTDEWKQKIIGDKWYLGDTYHLAIGQGYLLVTPLQVNNWTNVIASGGKKCKPHLTKIPNKKNDYCEDIGVSTETIKLIQEGMKEACQAGGTGWPLFDFQVSTSYEIKPKKINISCKTGTAEFGEKLGSGYAKTHAWFTSYAPAEKPEISVTVLVEGAGEGSDVAAPVAKKIYEEWFRR